LGGANNTSKLLSPTYFKTKGNRSMKALKFKCLKENTKNREVHIQLYTLYVLEFTDVCSMIIFTTLSLLHVKHEYGAILSAL
jgi:hypothetical protein